MLFHCKTNETILKEKIRAAEVENNKLQQELKQEKEKNCHLIENVIDKLTEYRNILKDFEEFEESYNELLSLYEELASKQP